MTAGRNIGGLRGVRPANDEALQAAENAHRSAVRSELERMEARLLVRLARGTFSADVWSPAAGGPERRHLFDLLVEHRRLLVVGGRAAGKTALVSFLAAQAARTDLGFGDVVPIVVAVDRMAQPELDEAEIGRLNPGLGEEGVRHAMQAGRALLLVDGLDRAELAGALKASIVALSDAYPAARLLVTTRPLPPKLAGRSETALAGFPSVRMAPPETAAASVEELDEHRFPARRVERIASTVSDLLEAWGPGRLPSGSALARFTSRGRLILVSFFAMSRQEGRSFECREAELVRWLAGDLAGARWFADTEQILHAEERPQGGAPLEDREAVARQILHEIRRHPGVLVEKRPGVFAFATLAAQQHLAALYLASERHVERFVEVRGDPWWEEVIVLAAGLEAPYSSALPAPRLLRALLDASAAADSATTFLAARCAEVARHVPDAIRREIAERLRAVVPPRSSLQVIHLVDDIGEVAAPALLKALATAGADERAFIATALGRLDHPPAVRVLARLVSDGERTTEPVLCWVWTVDAVAVELPVGFFAFAAFFNLALTSPAAQRMLDGVLEAASGEVLGAFIGLIVEKALSDDHWGVEAEPERDAGWVDALIDKVLRAAEARGSNRRGSR